MTGKAWIGFAVSLICLVLLGLTPTQRKRPPILGKTYKLVFHSIEGLKVGDPVVVGGVDAGRVANIDFAPREDWTRLNKSRGEQPVVLVTVAIEGGMPVPTSAGYKVVSTLRGTHFVNIVPGAGAPMATGDVLEG